MAVFSTEAEFVVLCTAAIWMWGLFGDLGVIIKGYVVSYENDQSLCEWQKSQGIVVV